MIPSDTIQLISTFLTPEDAHSLRSTNKIFYHALAHIPFCTYYLSWSSTAKEIRNCIVYSTDIHTLTLDHFEFFPDMHLSLPNLRKLTLKNCQFENLDFVKLYPTVRDVIVQNCRIQG
jgi:hypothetical protein